MKNKNELYPGYDETLEDALERLIKDELTQLAKDNPGNVTGETIKLTVRTINKHFFLYCQKNLFITTKSGELKPLVLNRIQRIVAENVIDDLVNGRPVRYIILKARQEGVSTVIGAMCYWWTATHRYTNSAIVAHRQDAASNIYAMFKRYYDNSAQLFRPKRKYLTKTDGLVFDDPRSKPGEERKGQAKGLKSEVKTFVASTSTGRSNTIQFLHASEVAFWENPAETVSGLMQTVPSLENTFVFLESTANGVGDYFYETWNAAIRGDSVFKPLFFAWWQHDEYEFNLPSHFKIKPEEEDLAELMRENGIPENNIKRKLVWWRWKQKEFAANPDKLYQEYPATPEEAFIASGRPRFHMKSLAEMRKKAELPDSAPKYYNLLRLNRANVEAEEVIVQSVISAPPLKVWDLPEPGEKYVIGGDVAEGLEIASSGKAGDYSVATVVRTRDAKVVARWRGHIDPDMFGEEIYDLGVFYNQALVAVEVNNHGLTTIAKLKDLLYRNMYRQEKGHEEWFEESTSRLGWRTTSKSKPLMIDGLATAIRESVIIDLDSTFINECMTYVVDENGRTNAQVGCHDDTVISTAIAFQMFDWDKTRQDMPQMKKPLANQKLLGKNRAPVWWKKPKQKIRQT